MVGGDCGRRSSAAPGFIAQLLAARSVVCPSHRGSKHPWQYSASTRCEQVLLVRGWLAGGKMFAISMSRPGDRSGSVFNTKFKREREKISKTP